jgi:hypothetical protein
MEAGISDASKIMAALSNTCGDTNPPPLAKLTEQQIFRPRRKDNWFEPLIITPNQFMFSRSGLRLRAWPVQADWIYALAISPDGTKLALGDWRGEARVITILPR